MIPPIGLGTSRTGGYECFNAVGEALEIGYRHVDTTMAYENEAAVGRAIEVSTVDRDDAFVTTKLKGYPEFLDRERLIEAVEGMLQRLGMDRIDLVLIHWWHPSGDMGDVFGALSELVKAGKIDYIGVSNFSIEQLQRAMDASEVRITTNQVQYNPYFHQDELLSFCRENNVLLTAYSPLAEGLAAEDETLSQIGDQYGKSAAQVAIRWLVQQDGVVTIPKTVRPDRLRENLDVFDFELTNAQMDRIHDLEGPLWFRLNHDRGAITRFRSRIGQYVPKRIRDAIS
ncbi:aldo/keto reductase [Halorubrum kocurii]|uniref:Aldo/keto reductase n=1 Tax=Halorubrum kocurii JCM 14978 TaxID=1230456 RepID=M0NKU5_9EURY|nr:aldo/keto reductase [Halorubrum kocurii]EMA57754.1 aldo/keto reductase [Halorubrum kocurii JCM 14978]